MPAFETILSHYQGRIEDILKQHLQQNGQHPLLSAMHYSTLNGGKRLRALLVYLSGNLVNAPVEELDIAAASVEMIHAFSLIHDDLPAMDNDVLRRGKPTCHVAFGEATAILAGDALQSLAFQLLASTKTPYFCPEKRLCMIAKLSRATGYLGMAGGQLIDIQAIGQKLSGSELAAMHALKTGELISASVALGMIAGDTTQQEKKALMTYGKQLGLAFQIYDDILDVEGSAAEIGKTSKKDELHAKPTYPSMLGLKQSKQLADEARQGAIAALSSFGEKAEPLRQLADYVVTRKN